MNVDSGTNQPNRPSATDPELKTRTLHPRKRAAFTLVELLVSIAIVLILVTLGVTGAATARNAQRIRDTEATLSVLETALDEYRSRAHTVPPLAVPGEVPKDPNPQVNALRLFVSRMQAIDTAKHKVKGLGPAFDPARGTVLDGWGNEVRMWGNPATKTRWFWSVGKNGADDSPQVDPLQFPGNPVNTAPGGDDLPGQTNKPQDESRK